MLQTPEEIERGITIARNYIDANDYPLRESALFLLQRHSTMEREAERVLAAVQKYLDELFIDALKKTPPEMVLEPLQQLRSAFAEKYADFTRYAEYQDLSSVIEVLEQKAKIEREK
jgi:phosphoglycolate phosphatase-like HAD superfamily hydrolase